MSEKLVVVVLFGGRSSEHSISCVTAGGVLGAISREHYDVIPVGITGTGAYVLEEDNPAKFVMDPDNMPRVVANGSKVIWPEDTTTRELRVRDADGTERSLGDVDIVFPVLHGPYGEDGTVQGMLELAGLPYVGSKVLGSALAMDKHFTKAALLHEGLPVAPWQTVTKAKWAADPEAVAAAAAELGSPLFVKPARAGSSVGVSKVSQPSDLPAAINKALEEDGKVLIESAVVGREVECAVLSSHDGAPRVSVAGEIVVTGREFYDFEAKYLDASAVQLVCPAALTDEELATMQELAAAAFQAVDADVLARVDFFLTDDGFVINELNTMPGFTPISMFPACWAASGIGYSDLIDELIQLSLVR